MSIAEAPAEVAALPTHLDLPCTDGKPVENTFQHPQSVLLTGALRPALDRLHPDGQYLIGADTGIYWRHTKDPLDGCKAPDWFYVPNVPPLLDGEFRRSYVMWQEYAYPLIVIEYVSGDGSEERDQTPQSGKFWIYERRILATFYLIWDPVRRALDAFELIRGRYQPLAPDANGRYRIPAMEVDFGVWDGVHMGTSTSWLRAWDGHGRLLPTPDEFAAIEHQRAEKLAAKLRELGIDPDSV
jgi:Uma2 family endonuclease